MLRTLLLIVFIFGSVLGCVCQQNEISQGWEISTPASNAAINADIDLKSYSIFTIKQARDLLLNTVCASKACDPDAKDFYAIVHVLGWNDLQSATKQSMVGEHWYVYHPEGQGWSQDKFTDGKRLYNAKYFYLLYIDLHVASTASYQPLYQIQITKKLPQNIADVFALLQLEATPSKATNAQPTYDLRWGGRIVDIGQRPSDVKIDPRTIPDPAKPGTSDEISTAQTFNNEGKYWWDVSVAVPVKKISQLSFNSTNNTVVPSQTATTNMFALLDLYYPPVDLSQSSYSFIPHPIVGVSMAQQPLHKILVGGAVGLYFAEVYVGALFVKQQSLTGLSTGSSATPQALASASHFNYQAQFSVGINLPVRSIVNSIKNKK